MDFEWMAWTPITAAIFIGIGLLLTGMTIWEILSPTLERRGLLPIPTTRGDRFFIGMLGSAYIVVAWIGLSDMSLWFALLGACVYMGLVMRFG